MPSPSLLRASAQTTYILIKQLYATPDGTDAQAFAEHAQSLFLQLKISKQKQIYLPLKLNSDSALRTEVMTMSHDETSISHHEHQCLTSHNHALKRDKSAAEHVQFAACAVNHTFFWMLVLP